MSHGRSPAGRLETCSNDAVIRSNLRFRRPAQCDQIRRCTVGSKRSCVFQQSGPNDWGSFPGSSVPVSPALALVGFVGLCLLVGAVGGSMTARAVHGWYPDAACAPGNAADLGVRAGLDHALCDDRRRRLAGVETPRRRPAVAALGLAACRQRIMGAGVSSDCTVPLLAMGVMVVLLVLVALTIRAFRRVHRIAAMLMVPYGAWCLYAAYLNAGFLVLNHDLIRGRQPTGLSHPHPARVASGRYLRRLASSDR